MRSIKANVLLGLAIFLLLLAPLLAFYAAPRLEKAPLDQYSVTTATATGTLFDREAGVARQGVDLSSTRVVRGDAKAGDGDTAVWDVFLRLETGDQLIRATTDRVAFDRHTTEAENCCGENIDGNPVKHAGISYKFPFDTKKTTYDYYDTTILRATPMKFIGTDKIEGLSVYKFEQVIEPEDIGGLQVPGSWVGKPDVPAAQVRQYYGNVRTVFVEPKTGVIVKGSEQQKRTLRIFGSDSDLVTLLEAPLTFNQETIDDLVKTAEDGKSQLRLIGTIVPLACLVLGLLVLAGAFLLDRRSPGGQRRMGEVPAGTPSQRSGEVELPVEERQN